MPRDRPYRGESPREFAERKMSQAAPPPARRVTEIDGGRRRWPDDPKRIQAYPLSQHGRERYEAPPLEGPPGIFGHPGPPPGIVDNMSSGGPPRGIDLTRLPPHPQRPVTTYRGPVPSDEWFEKRSLGSGRGGC